MASAKLTKSIVNGKVTVKKKVSGEVRISFYSNTISDININHNNPEEVTSYPGVTPQMCKKSNLDYLINNGFIVIV